MRKHAFRYQAKKVLQSIPAPIFSTAQRGDLTTTPAHPT